MSSKPFNILYLFTLYALEVYIQCTLYILCHEIISYLLRQVHIKFYVFGIGYTLFCLLKEYI